MSTFGVLFFTTLFFFLFMAISWFVFNYMCIPRIDKRISDDGKSKASPVDIWGLRTLNIAIAVSLPLNCPLNHDHNPFINPKDVHPYATKLDRIIGFILVASTALGIITGVISSFFVPQ